ncbi:unnamed protein product [Gadus morhua 'NCC']
MKRRILEPGPGELWRTGTYPPHCFQGKGRAVSLHSAGRRTVTGRRGMRASSWATGRRRCCDTMSIVRGRGEREGGRESKGANDRDGEAVILITSTTSSDGGCF